MTHSFWDFSTRLYGSPGVADECLLLQDDYGIDVNVLLFCGYAAAIAGVPLTDHNLADIERNVAEIRIGVVAPLRECRRAMKDAVARLTNGERERAEHLRSQVKELELAAERLEQERLVAWLTAAQRASHRSGADEIDGNLNRLLARHSRNGGTGPFPDRLAQAAHAFTR